MMARHQKVFEARSSSELKFLIQMFSFFFSKGGVQVCKEGRGGVSKSDAFGFFFYFLKVSIK